MKVQKDDLWKLAKIKEKTIINCYNEVFFLSVCLYIYK